MINNRVDVHHTVSIVAVIVLMSVVVNSCTHHTTPPDIFHPQGEMAGEVTQTSVILQSRLTSSDSLIAGDLPGCQGFARFEFSSTVDFRQSPQKTQWIEAVPGNDYIIKTKVVGLTPGTRYYYRIEYGRDKRHTLKGNICTFRTLAGSDTAEAVRFVVVTGMNYSKFHFGLPNKPEAAYEGADKHLGYPALKTILAMNPDFFVGTGDNVYYDHPPQPRAMTVAEMRKKWHEQFAQERYKKLFARIPTYWEKDDHDYRYNDADTTSVPDGAKPGDTLAESSHELGITTFIEQLPVAAPEETEPKTYRTHRINKLLQIWLVEGRDYRSPNSMQDGPGKTLWGEQQKAWLKQTLLESGAAFKILISPTPLVGPDDAYKIDNHVNHKGFRHEGDGFFRWLKDNDFLDKNFYIVCGDRHWQYHSIHPSGFEEFSCGALVDANSRLGRNPGDPRRPEID